MLVADSYSEDVDDSPHSRHDSRRNQALRCPLLETQAIEEDKDGNCLSGSDNSADDRDLTNLSYVTDGADAYVHFSRF